MSSFDAVVRLTAQDQASPVVDAATKSILANYKVMRQEVRSVTAEFQLQNQTLVAAGNAFRSVAGVANTFMNVFTEFQTMQIRVTDANNQLILAQLHYNQVLAEQGPGTNDAIAASIQLQEAKTNVAQATQQETIGYIGMALQLGGAVSQIINAIPIFERLALKIGLLTAAKVALNAVPNTGVSIPTATTTATTVATTAGTTAATTAATAAGGAGIASLAIRLGSAALKIAPRAGAAGAGVELLSMMGQQQAGETNVPTGVDALIQVGNDTKNAIVTGLTNLYNYFTGNQGNQQNGKVEHVVTVKIQSNVDHITATQEQSMGIEQVMSSGH